MASLFKPFKTFSLNTLNIQPSTKKNYFPTSSTSFLSTFSQVARTWRKLPLFQARQISAYSPTQQLSLAKDVKLNNFPNLRQGHNECGHATLAMNLWYYYNTDSTYKQKVDQGIYRIGNFHEWGSDTVGHGPKNLYRLASEKGMTIRQENNGSINDWVALLDKGIPVIVLGINGGGANSSSLPGYFENIFDGGGHWMPIIGYKTDTNGNTTHFYVNDPNYSYTRCISVSEVMEFCNNNLIPGGHRYYMAIAPQGSFKETLLTSYLSSDKISENFETWLEAIDALETLFYELEKIAGSATIEVWNAVNRAAQEIQDAIASGVNAITNIIEDAISGAKNFFNDLWNGIEEIVDWAGETAGEVADTTEDVWDDIWDEVSSWF